MKFMLFVLPTVPGTLDDRKRLRPIARKNERALPRSEAPAHFVEH